jgi:broad-specificity NMP kinase
MSLIFITGAPGSGKTAATAEIAGRGFTIYDTDDPNHTGMAGWHNLATGKYVAGFNEVEVTEDLLATHVWGLTSNVLDELQLRSETELIYLCGRLRDAQSVLTASQAVLFLTVSGQTIEDRLKKRAKTPGEVEWGREPWQVERSIAVNQQIEEEYRKIGAVMIDANLPLVEVVDCIINATAQI